MKKIVLLCAGGASTGMLVAKLNKESENQNLGYHFSAFGIAEAVSVANDADVVLLGPQVAYQLDAVKASLPHVQVSSINMMDYGMMNLPNILKQVADLIGE